MEARRRLTLSVPRSIAKMPMVATRVTSTFILPFDTCPPRPALWCRSAGSAAPRTKVKLQLKQSAPASTTAVPAAVPAATVVTTPTDTQASRDQQLRLSLRALGESFLPAALASPVIGPLLLPPMVCNARILNLALLVANFASLPCAHSPQISIHPHARCPAVMAHASCIHQHRCSTRFTVFGSFPLTF